jgi:hypothetical protein
MSMISHSAGKTAHGIRWEYRTTTLGAARVGSLKQPAAKPVSAPFSGVQKSVDPHFAQKRLLAGGLVESTTRVANGPSILPIASLGK